MPRCPSRLHLLGVVILSTVPSPAAAQLGFPPAQPGAEQEKLVDPLGRGTPHSTVSGFLRSVQQGRYRRAAQYLQMTEGDRRERGAEISEQLQTVLDVGFKTTLDRISNNPDGRLDDAADPSHEIAGPIRVGDEEAELILVRVNDARSGPIWLVAAETVAEVAALYVEAEKASFDRWMPQSLQGRILGVKIWQAMAVVLLMPIALGISWILVAAGGWVLRLASRGKIGGKPKWAETLTLGMILYTIATRQLGMSLLFSTVISRLLGVVISIWAILWTWKLLDLASKIAMRRAKNYDRGALNAILTMTRRILKAFTLLVAVLVTLSVFGLNVNAAVAGLGIGGVALALAAQKTIENLFGGVSVATDKIVRVGDFCRFGTQTGTVEDIGLRSTRIRTPERTEVSIPNGVLATMTVENLSMREKILFNPVIGVRYESTPEQLKFLLTELRRVLHEHPMVETEGSRVRLARFGASALEVDVFAYMMVTDIEEHSALREELLLRMMEVVHESGCGFAFPSQTLYLSRDRLESGRGNGPAVMDEAARE